MRWRSTPAATPTGRDTRREESGVEHPWRALWVTLLVGYMALLDVTIVNVAVPSIEEGLGASPQAVQWVISGYALTFGLTLVAGGRLGDVVGRRRMFLFGLVAFVVTSAAAGAAWNSAAIVAARLLQGAAAGLLTPQNTGLIQQLFTGEDRGRAFGFFGATVGISAASGPLLGGLLINAFGTEDGWRWVFYVNVPVGLVAMLLAVRLLPGRSGRGGHVWRQVDVPGALLLGAAVLCLLLPVVEAESDPGTPLWATLLLAPVFLVLFVRHERHVVRRGGAPLLDVRLFTETAGFSRGIAIGTVYFTGFAGTWLVLALLFQQQLGYSALQSGLAVMPFALASAASAVVAGRLVSSRGRRVTVVGLSLVVLGFAGVGTAVAWRQPHDVALVDGAPAAGGRAGERCHHLAQRHADSRPGADQDGRRRRRCAADRAAHRQRPGSCAPRSDLPRRARAPGGRDRDRGDLRRLGHCRVGRAGARGPRAPAAS